MSDAAITKAAPLPGDIPDDFTLDELREAVTEDELAAFEATTADIDMQPQAEDGAQQAAAQQDAAPAPGPEPVQQVQIPDVSQARATVAELETQIDALAAKYDEGELTRSEWLAQQRILVDQQAKAQTQIIQAEQMMAQAAQTVQQRWFSGLESYKAAGNAALWSEEHIGGWDAALKSVSGNQAYSGLPFERQFQLAHDMYAAHYRATTGRALPTAAGKKADGEFKVALDPLEPNKGPREEAPMTLAGLNGDTANAISDGTLASIMASDPERAESLLSRLSDADFERLALAV